HVEQGLADANADVREQALRLSEPFLAANDSLGLTVLTKVNDASPRVRFQAAFTIGGLDSASAAVGLSRALRRDGADPWMQSAALSSAARCSPELLTILTGDAEFLAQRHAGPVLTRIATIVGAQADPAALARVF